MSASGVGIEQQEVGDLAGNDDADVVVAQEESAVAGGGDDRLHGREAGLHHQLHLAMQAGAVQGADIAGVRAGGDAHAGVAQPPQIGGALGIDRRHRRGEDAARPHG